MLIYISGVLPIPCFIYKFQFQFVQYEFNHHHTGFSQKFQVDGEKFQVAGENRFPH